MLLVVRLVCVMLLPTPSVWMAVISIMVVGVSFVPWYPTPRNPLVFKLVLNFVLAMIQLDRCSVAAAVTMSP